MDQMMEPIRNWGGERLEFARGARTQKDWEKWEPPKFPFIFEFGPCWNFAPEYKVRDFEAEVGFFIDLLGFETNGLTEDFCMLMPPKKDFYFSIKKSTSTGDAVALEGFSLQFMIKDIDQIVASLKGRGVKMTQDLQNFNAGLRTAKLQTPNGVEIVLWGVVNAETP